MNRLRSQPKAVIFDMDGVIVDSMPYHFIAWYEALRPFGIRVSCFEVFLREGERWDKTIGELLLRKDIKPGKAVLKKIFRLREKIFNKYFKRFIFSGVEEFLVCLKKKKYLLGLVTGTPWQEVKRILPKNIVMLFDAIITGDKVKNGKPHPEPYLKAAAKLKLNPRECVVVENSPLGIASAKKAAMFCVAVTTSLPKEYLKMADQVVDDIADITAIIDKTCRS